MRFTIRQLMLLPVVFLLNTWLVAFFAFPALRSFPWQHETNSVMNAQHWVESAMRYAEYDGITVDDQTLNEWLDNQLSPNHPASVRLMAPPRPDAWGNPYRVQTRKSIDEKLRVYSTGEDGLSNTDGNDPDDIRSWDEKRWRWYSRRQFTRETLFCMIVSALITTAGFWLFTYKPKSTSNKAPRRG